MHSSSLPSVREILHFLAAAHMFQPHDMSLEEKSLPLGYVKADNEALWNLSSFRVTVVIFSWNIGAWN